METVLFADAALPLTREQAPTTQPVALQIPKALSAELQRILRQPTVVVAAVAVGVLLMMLVRVHARLGRLEMMLMRM